MSLGQSWRLQCTLGDGSCLIKQILISSLGSKMFKHTVGFDWWGLKGETECIFKMVSVSNNMPWSWLNTNSRGIGILKRHLENVIIVLRIPSKTLLLFPSFPPSLLYFFLSFFLISLFSFLPPSLFLLSEEALWRARLMMLIIYFIRFGKTYIYWYITVCWSLENRETNTQQFLLKVLESR